MKKKFLLISSIVIMLLVSLIGTSFAAAASAELKVSDNKVKKGETFKVTLAVGCEDGINSVSAKYSYDDKILELVEEEATSDWSSNSIEQGDIQVIYKPLATIKQADVYELTFKVKDDAKSGDSATISMNSIEVDTDLSEDSKREVSNKMVVITIEEEATQGKDDGQPENSTTPNGTTGNKDGEESKEEVPDTGAASTALTIIALVTIAVISYTSYSRYKNI